MTDEWGRQALSRRAFLFGGGAIGAAAIAPSIVLAQAGALVVETTSGRVQGFLADGVAHFRGIPYGGDTSVRNRFMPPTRPVAWSGVRDCTQWGHVAPQANNTSPSLYTRMVGWNNYRGGMSEDCLVLNVWTPAADARRRAVMVVFHGGGFTTGSGNLVALEGHYMKAMIATDVRIRRNAVVQAERKAAQHRAPAYLYRWDWPAPGGDGQWGAVHRTDLSPAMSNPTTPTTMDTPGARKMSQRIGQAFIAFAKRGDPNHPAIPRWPTYDSATRAVMVFDDQTRVVADPDRDLRLMWNRLNAA